MDRHTRRRQRGEVDQFAVIVHDQRRLDRVGMAGGPIARQHPLGQRQAKGQLGRRGMAQLDAKPIDHGHVVLRAVAVGDENILVALANEHAELGAEADGENFLGQVMAVPEPRGKVHAHHVTPRLEAERFEHLRAALPLGAHHHRRQDHAAAELAAAGVRHLRAVDRVHADGQVRPVVFQRSDGYDHERASIASFDQLSRPQVFVTRLEVRGRLDAGTLAMLHAWQGWDRTPWC